MKLGLGTVQFGLPYGVANRTGQVTQSDVRSILDLARAHQIDTLDTAVSYGESEQRLGLAGVQSWKIVSKLPPLPVSCANIEEWVVSTVHTSLQRLGINRLYGLLLHRPGQLLEEDGPTLYRALQMLKSYGLVQKIGVSIYDPVELDEILCDYSIDLLQAPFNVFDRRLIDSGWLERLQKHGAELHVRSVFLQGLLLMTPADRPGKFQRWNGVLTKWTRWLESHQLTPIEACLRYAMSFPQISKVLVGVDGVSQLQEIIQASIGEVPPIPAFPEFEDSILLNPARWNELV